MQGRQSTSAVPKDTPGYTGMHSPGRQGVVRQKS